MTYRKILYRSVPLHDDYHPSDLEILRSAMHFNKEAGVTGYLWRANGQFFQALHGSVDSINLVLERILKDTRHKEVEILLDDYAPEKTPFAGFSMGYDHFFPSRLGLEFTGEGKLPRLNRNQSSDVFDALTRVAKEALSDGGGFLYSRRANETEASYQARIEAALV